MPPYQRRHGLPIKVWKVSHLTDNRGNKVDVPTTADQIEETCWVFPQRSSKASVPGQVGIEVTRIGVRADLEDVDLWSRVELRGRLWDVAAPPAYHHGTRHTRHWSIDLRLRP